MQQIKCMQFQYQLEKGDILHVNGFPVEYLGDGKIGTNTMLYKTEATVSKKDCKCIDPCHCKTLPTPSKQEMSKSLEELIKALEKDMKDVQPGFLKKSPWTPNGGLVLDPLDNTVYGPGCRDLNGKVFGGDNSVAGMKIGEGCCST
jgi:hypothetical protein